MTSEELEVRSLLPDPESDIILFKYPYPPFGYSDQWVVLYKYHTMGETAFSPEDAWSYALQRLRERTQCRQCSPSMGIDLRAFYPELLRGK